jgi:hypothetical protein
MISPSSSEMYDQTKATMLIVHGSTIERAPDGRADVVLIGQRGQRDVGPGDAPAR